MKAEDNKFPYMTAVEGTTPATPDSGDQRLFVDIADGLLKLVDDTGTVTPVGGGGGGMTNPMTTVGDIIIGGSSGTPTRLASPADATKYLDGTGAYSTPAGGGGGSFTHAYIGYNTVGGSSVGMSGTTQYLKKVTVASAGLIASVGAYLQGNADNVSSISAGVLADAAGLPADILAAVGSGGNSQFMIDESSSAHSGPARWIHFPIGLWVTAGDYWLAISGESRHDIFFDGSGSDVTEDNGGFFSQILDGRRYTNVNSGNKYSIRASFLS